MCVLLYYFYCPFVQRMKISDLDILKLKCNQQQVEQSTQLKVMHSPQIMYLG